MAKVILVINPGSTSTKIAVFQDKEKMFEETIRHNPEELKDFDWCMEQVDYRKHLILSTLAEKGVVLSELSAICSRGGMIPPCESGAYRVDQQMVDYMYSVKKGAHVSNIGCVIAYQIANTVGIPAYIYDPVTVDELVPIARITGLPEIQRGVIGHTLNTRAIAMKCAKEKLGKEFDESTIIAAHIGGGISVRLLQNGRNIDACNDDNGGMSPERSGGLPALQLIKLCFSGKYTETELIKKIRGNGGLKALLGTSDALVIEKRIEQGDQKAKLIYEAMAYSIAKDIGQLAVVVGGKVDAIALTGGIAYSKLITSSIAEKVSFIAPVYLMPGEHEMEAMAAGTLRVERGEEAVKSFSGIVQNTVAS